MVNRVIDTMRAADLEEVNVIIGKGAKKSRQKQKRERFSIVCR